MTKTAKQVPTRSNRKAEAQALKPRRSNARQGPNAKAQQAVEAPRTKLEQVAVLLVRDEGASLEQLIAATGWLPHTTRAALTGLRKRGYAIDSDKVDGTRTYRAVAPE